MKVIKLITLFAVCLTMAACSAVGGEDLEAYKDKMLEGFAKKAKSTKELLIRDFDVIVDSMSVIPFTVADSLAVIDSFKVYKSSLESELKLNEGFRSSYMTRKKIEELKTKISDTEKVLEKESYYNGMKKSKVLVKVFRARVALKVPLWGRKVDFGYFVFSPDGEFQGIECSERMKNHIEASKLK